MKKRLKEVKFYSFTHNEGEGDSSEYKFILPDAVGDHLVELVGGQASTGGQGRTTPSKLIN